MKINGITQEKIIRKLQNVLPKDTSLSREELMEQLLLLSGITEEEIREFYGAVCAKNDSRGIFVTTSVFHPGAVKLLLSIENCVGIDGEKLFYLAEKTSYGIRLTKEGYRFDNSVF